MLFPHKLSSSDNMVPFQTSITSNPINKIILLTSTHNVINVSNVYVKVLNTFGRCQITLSLVLSLSTCIFAFILVFFFFFSAFYFYFSISSSFLIALFFSCFCFFFSFFSSVFSLSSSLFVGIALTKFREGTAEVVTFKHVVHVLGDMMVLVRE